MRTRKRTSQQKHTPPASPTSSTLHSLDQHQHQLHHLRHTGPSISTRTSASSKPPPEHTSESAPDHRDVREKGKGSLKEVSPPGARTPFSKFVYLLLTATLVLLAWYLYGMAALLGKLKEEVGWWGIIVGESSQRRMHWDPGRRRADEVDLRGDPDGSLNALADALGISPAQVASAVKPLVPDASLTSIASRAAETGVSEAIRVLLEAAAQDGRGSGGARVVAKDEAEKNVADENVVWSD